MPLDRVIFLNSGYCTQSSYLAGRGSWDWARFYAVFVYLEHPRHGPTLIDTGYSNHFRQATETFPECVYRWLTPATLDPDRTPPAILRRHGIDPGMIRTLFVSHFHGDHIAGLRDFPGVRFVYRREALESLSRQSRRVQVRHGVLAGLLPEDFRERGTGLGDDEFTICAEGPTEFRSRDIWGDGSLILVDLPGHAEGHTGYLLQTRTERIFYLVDAAWDLGVLLAGRALPWLSRGFQWDYPAYVQTAEKLRRVAETQTCRLVACHCPRTQEFIGRSFR